ncbi:AtzE family amidohydrolase [Paraburkholderia sp. MM5482-R2]
MSTRPSHSAGQEPSLPPATVSARVEQTLAKIAARNHLYNAFTCVTADRARQEAAEVDRRIAAGEPPGALAGMTFGVKNLFDVAGITTLAGGKVNRTNPPATRDAPLIERLTQAGAVLVGTLNMDEHAYGFTTENTHFGACVNPHDPSRLAGGSSGGSAAAVASGLVPLALGSDTNGSIRVPSSLCGIFGLKPTFGRLPRGGTFPFVNSLDHLGPIARHVVDLAKAYDVMQGPDADDIACAQRPVEAAAGKLSQVVPGTRIAILGGYFEAWADPTARAAVQAAAAGLGATDFVELPGAERARAAAFIITAAEGGALHRARLQSHYDEYEPLNRDRLVAGSLMPASWVVQAHRIRQQFRLEMARLFEQYDLVLAAATPVVAPRPSDALIEINGRQVPARAALGILTQPISFAGLPTCVVPLWPSGQAGDALPIGVQLIAAPWRETDCLAAASHLESLGIARCQPH